MLHHKATVLNAGKRLEPTIEHQRKRRLRSIEVDKRAVNGNAPAAEQVIGKVARQVDTRGAQGRDGVQSKASRRLGRKFLHRMADANGNHAGCRPA